MITTIFFDAAGTLFEVNGSVGEIYARIAANYGITLDAQTIQQRFAWHFPLQPPLAFAPELSATQRFVQEKKWWRVLVQQVLQEAGNHPRLADYFDEVFTYFGQREAWKLFDDVIPTLQVLQQRQLRIGLISNFDARLYSILTVFDLSRYFDSIHLSSEVGVAKPDPAIFQAALSAHQIEARQALHIGDSWRDDYEGALASGIRAVLVKRHHHAPTPDAQAQISHLNEILSII